MPIYNYKAKNQLGSKITGTVYGISKEEAIASLQNRELTILKINEKPAKVPFWQKNYGSVSFKEKIIFLKYMSTILKSGLSIKKALEILSVQVKNKYFAEILNSIREEVENGQTFHESLNKYPKVFSPIFVNMVAVGEVSGTLPSVLAYLDDLLSKEYSLKRKVKGAMTYPIIILTLVIVVSLGLIKFIIPRITAIFDNFDFELPIMTRILIRANEILTNQWPFILVGIILLFVMTKLLFEIKSVRFSYHKFMLKVPVVGSLIKQIQITRFTRISASLIQSGITLVEAMKITSNTLSSLVYHEYLSKAVPYLSSGGELSEFLAKRPDLFENIITQMISLGESTGTLDNNLLVLAALNDEEIDEKIKNLSNLIGPLLLIFMSAIVGGIAISIITPIYKLPSLVQDR
jgi:type IV pilus assembly protein PilC